MKGPIGICEWKRKCTALCGSDKLSPDGRMPSRFSLDYDHDKVAERITGWYGCWCCFGVAWLRNEPDPLAGMDGGVFETIEEGKDSAPTKPKGASGAVKKTLNVSALPAWVWVVSFLLPVLFMIASKVLTRGLAKAKVYKTPGGLSPVKLVTGKAKLSKESLLQMLTSYLQVVENADGTASWHANSCFMGIARKHGLLSVCYGDVNELSTSCRVGLIIFSILMASSLSTAFGSATLGTYSTCDYQCEVFPEGWPLNGAKGAGVECTYDDTPSIFDDQKEIKIEVDGSYFTSTGLFIFAINKLYDMGCGMLLGAATRKGHASHSGALVIGSVVAVVAVGAIAMAASVVYLQQSGTCPNKASSTSKSVISTGHLSRSEFADNFLYGCNVQAPLADPCDESCHEIPIGEKLRVCIIGAVIGLLIEWLAWKPIVQGGAFFFIAKNCSALDTFDGKPAIEEPDPKSKATKTGDVELNMHANAS